MCKILTNHSVTHKHYSLIKILSIIETQVRNVFVQIV